MDQELSLQTNWSPPWSFTVNNNLLFSVAKKGIYPFESPPANAITKVVVIWLLLVSEVNGCVPDAAIQRLQAKDFQDRPVAVVPESQK